MSRSCVDLTVNLNEVLTPASFSTILVQLLKYIAYNSKSIPYSYEGFSHLVKRKRYLLGMRDDSAEARCTYNDILAKNYFAKVSEAFDNYEATFKSLWEELKCPDKVKQIIFLSGNTLVNPRYSYRIQKPFLSVEDCENAPPVRKSLETILRTLLSSTHLNSIFENVREPSNLFILIELSEGETPKTEWFVPFDNFSPALTKKEIKIILNSPSSTDTTLEESFKTEESSSSSKEWSDLDDSKQYETCTNWFRSKETLKGFKDLKIAGKSVVNYLLES